MAAQKMLLCGFFGQPWFFLRYGHSIYPYGVYVKKNPKYLFLNNRVSEKGHRPKAMPLLLFLFFTLNLKLCRVLYRNHPLVLWDKIGKSI